MMPRILRLRAAPVLLVASLVAFAMRASAGTLVQNATLVHDGVTRYFDYWVPDDLPAAPAPLLFVLHGGTQNNKLVLASASIEHLTLADAEKFLVVLPNGIDPATGLSGPSGSFHWNDCRTDASPDSSSTADDVGFVSALVEWADSNFDIDVNRVYSTGASNGGLMSYRLAFELSNRIAAIGAVIANLPANSECPAAPANPVGVLMMNGTADAFMPFGGGTIPGARGTVLSTGATRDFWRNVLGTGPSPVHVDVPDANPGDSSTVTIDSYCNGAQGAAVSLYTVTGGGHTMPSTAHPVPPAFGFLGPQNRDLEGAHEIWRFLREHRRNGCGPCKVWDVGSSTCVAAPRSGCLPSTNPTSSTLLVIDDPNDRRDRVTWSWPRGAATTLGDLGDPFGADGYALCVYDESAGTPALAFRAVAPGAESLCGTASRWQALGSDGFRYKDTERTPDGIRRMRVRAGGAGKAKATFKAEGENLSGRAFALPAPPLGLPLRVQLQVQTGACFEATYSAAGVLQNGPVRFKGRADP